MENGRRATDMPHDAHRIDSNRDAREGEAMGAGEFSLTLSPAAIGNAIVDATGARLCQIPFTSERVLEALS
jgi:CO/xanthine dehydrogenase Mo-binding subunit